MTLFRSLRLRYGSQIMIIKDYFDIIYLIVLAYHFILMIISIFALGRGNFAYFRFIYVNSFSLIFSSFIIEISFAYFILIITLFLWHDIVFVCLLILLSLYFNEFYHAIREPSHPWQKWPTIFSVNSQFYVRFSAFYFHKKYILYCLVLLNVRMKKKE